MALKAGFQAAKNAGSSGGGDYGDDYYYRLMLNSGQAIVVRFHGSFEDQSDPKVFTNHFIKRLAKGSNYHKCGRDFDKPCGFCDAKEEGDKGISASSRAGFVVYNFARKHKLDKEVRVLRPGCAAARPGEKPDPKNYENTKYPVCSGKNCQFCRGGNDAMAIGLRFFDLAPMFAEGVSALQYEVRNICRGCGTIVTDEDGAEAGTIQVDGYSCSHCGEQVHFDPENGNPVKCPSCGFKGIPNERIACTHCEAPERADLQDFKVRIKKNGEGKTTTYEFTRVGTVVSITPEEAEALEKRPIDWEKIINVTPASRVSALLGIPVAADDDDDTHGAAPRAVQRSYTQKSEEIDFGEEPSDDEDFGSPVQTGRRKERESAPGPAAKPRAFKLRR